MKLVTPAPGETPSRLRESLATSLLLCFGSWPMEKARMFVHVELKLIINSFRRAKLAKIRDIIMLSFFATALYMTEEGKEQRERRYVRQAGNWF